MPFLYSPMGFFHFNPRLAALLTPTTVSYGLQRCMLSRWNCVQSAGEGAAPAAALGIETSSDVHGQASREFGICRSGDGAEDGGVGFWPHVEWQCGRRRSVHAQRRALYPIGLNEQELLFQYSHCTLMLAVAVLLTSWARSVIIVPDGAFLLSGAPSTSIRRQAGFRSRRFRQPWSIVPA